MEKMREEQEMQELLELCGIERDEFPSLLPRIERAFNKLNITPEDIVNGKQRLNKYYDISLKSIRQILRLCVLEFVNYLLAKEDGKTVITGIMSPSMEPIGSVLKIQSNQVMYTQQNTFFVVFGCIFDKLVPILEAAESKWLKSGAVSHCANVKTLLGQIATGITSKPDLIISSGFLCETAPKTLDLLHELYGIPVYYYDSCQDRDLREFSDATKRTIAMTAKSLKQLVERIQELVGFELKEDVLQEVMAARSKLNAATAELYQILKESDPVPLSFTNDILISSLASLTLDINGLKEATAILNTLCEELRERLRTGWGQERKGAFRLLAILPCHYSDPRLEYLIEQMGMSIVSTDLFDLSYDSPQNPYEAMSMHLLSSLGVGLSKRIALIIDGCKKLQVEGVINRYHVGCRSVTGDALVIAEVLKQKVGIPVLTLEWENFDSRVYDHEQYTEKLENFKTILDNKKCNRM
jgi:hypothetical protein